MPWIGEAAVKASGRGVKPVDLLPDEALVGLASTEKIAADLADVLVQLDRHNHAKAPTAPIEGEGPAGVDPDSLRADATFDHATLNTLQRRHRRLCRELEEAQERDRRSIERDRPAGCWCLGMGGRNERTPSLGQGIDVRARRWITDYTTPDPDLVVFAEYCPCSDGARMASEHVAALHAAVERMAVERSNRELEAHWADVGLPDKSDRYPTLDDFPTADPRQAKAVAAIRDWHPPRWLYLYGLTRRGKTTLAAAVARHADQMGYSVRFRTMEQILDRLKAAMDHEGEAVDDVLKPLLQVEFLVIDDLGAEAATRWAVGRVLRMLDDRLNKELTTIITSNLDLGGTDNSLAWHLSSGGVDPDFRIQAGRIVARIREASDVVLVDGPTLEPARAEALPW